MSVQRFRPTRAGIIGLWDYTDETFEFDDGRLVLRGANGSGKTKALEVLFPFVFDARLSPQRLDPFSGEGRTMRQNLLFRPDRETAHGYVWMEFSDGDQHRTIGAGLRAQRQRDGVSSWYFVADSAMGDGWSVLDADRHPLTKGELASAIGATNVFETAGDYRARVDHELFGLGVDRYESMLQLVLFLRRPQLAKDLDVRKLSEILSNGLRPLDDHLLEQAARSFEDLEAVQRELDRLHQADAALERFMTRYRSYVRTIARERVDVVLRCRTQVRSARKLAESGDARVAEAAAEREKMQVALDDVVRAQREAEAKRHALIESSAYQGIVQLAELEGRVADAARVLAEAQKRLVAAGDRLEHARSLLQTANTQLNESLHEHDHVKKNVDLSASVAGIQWGTDEDLSALRSRVKVRVTEIRHVRECRRDVEGEERRATDAEKRVADAVARVEEADVAFEAANQAADLARDELEAGIDEWFESLSIDVIDTSDRDAIKNAVVAIDVTAKSLLREVLNERLQPRISDRTLSIARSNDRLGELREVVQQLQQQRSAIEAETDDAPIAPVTRQADREQRKGAPLWRLIDFASTTRNDDHGPLEAALQASGLLDAWVTPSGELDAPELVDTTLVVGAAASGSVLADVLVVDQEAKSDVPAQIVTAVLRSITLGDADVSIATNGRFRLGPLAGAARKEHAEFIGASARAARRRRRIAEITMSITENESQQSRVQSEIEVTQHELDALSQAVAGLPSTSALVTAYVEVNRRAERVSQARHAHEREELALLDARKRVTDARAKLVRDARERSLPSEPAELDAVDDAVTRLQDDMGNLARVQAVVQERQQRTTTLTDDCEQRSGDVSRESTHADVLQAEHNEHATRYAALQEALGPDAKDVLAQVESLAGHIEQLNAGARNADAQRTEAIEMLSRAQSDREHAHTRAEEAQQALTEAQTSTEVFERADLRAVLDVVSTGAITGVSTGATEADDIATLLDAATQGVVPTPERMKAAQTGVTNAFQVLESDLGSGYHPELDFDDSVMIVTVADDRGRHPVLSFAETTRRHRDEQAALLSERERQVFEDTLLTTLSSQIHERIFEARESLDAMNASLRKREMSSGLTLALSWAPVADPDEPLRATMKLLDQDPALLGPDDKDRLRAYLAGAIRDARASDPGESYRNLLSRVLDYRQWRAFGLRLVHTDGHAEELTRRVFNKLSGGEKATSLHLPLFAAASAHFSTAHERAPRLIALDEAFAGIDESTQAKLLGLTVEFELDLFLTGHDLWAAFPTVPGVAIYELTHWRDAHVVGALRFGWNGTELQELAAVAS